MTYSGSTAPCKEMSCVIYCRTAVTVLVLKAWINAELMVGNTAAKLSRLFYVNCSFLTLYICCTKFFSCFPLHFQSESDLWAQTVMGYQELQKTRVSSGAPQVQHTDPFPSIYEGQVTTV